MWSFLVVVVAPVLDHIVLRLLVAQRRHVPIDFRSFDVRVLVELGRLQNPECIVLTLQGVKTERQRD